MNLLPIIRRLRARLLTRALRRRPLVPAPRASAHPIVEWLEGRTLPSTFTWRGAAGGNWSLGANWDQGTAPTPGSDVVIDNGTTANDDISVEVHSLTLSRNSGLNLGGATLTIDTASALDGAVTLSGGNLVANGAVTLGGATSWSGGSMTGSASITNSGTLTISGGGDKFFDGGVALDNSGTIADTGSGRWRLEHGAALDNLSGGVVDLASGESLQQFSGGTAI